MKRLAAFIITLIITLSITSEPAYASSGGKKSKYPSKNYYGRSYNDVPEGTSLFSIKLKENELRAAVSDDGDTIILKWKSKSNAVKETVYIYNTAKGKFREYESSTYCNGSAYISDVKPETTYTFLVREFDKNDKVVFSAKATVTTYIASPTLKVSTVSKPKVTWKSNSEYATGYEVYAKKESYKSYCGYWYSRSRCPNIKELKNLGFKLYRSSGQKTSGSITYKPGKNYSITVRSYIILNGKKEYSQLTPVYHTSAPSSYVNGMKLNSKEVCRGEELDLVKKYVNSVVTKDMSNYERLEAVYELVASHGEYQNDITKIDGNRSVWQIMEKQEGQCASWAFCLDAMLEYAGFDIQVVRGLRKNGQQHFWNRIKINGELYELDAHIGTFLGKAGSSYYGYEVVQTY